jgi:hypothetical protein
MKRNIIFLILILFIINYKASFAISPNAVLASQLLSTAESQAKTDGHTNIVLTNIGTATTSLNIGITLDITFNLTTGKASAWAYAFYDKDNDSIFVYGAVDFNITKVAQSLGAADLQGFSDYITKDTLPSGWKDSDALMNLIGLNGTYIYYKNNNTNLYMQSLGLGVNSENYLLEIGKPYWFANFYDSLTANYLTCYVQALTGDCSCESVSSVLDNKLIKSNLNIYPNPTSDVINIQIPNDMSYQDATLRIIDLNGNIVNEMNVSSIYQQKNIQIGVSNLSNGTYRATLMNNNVIYTSKFVIDR